MRVERPSSMNPSLTALERRRAFLTVGGLGMVGLSQADVLRAAAENAGPRATAKSVILLFQFGGPSHLDTFDPKPNAPAEIRGEYESIDTNVPAIRVTEHLPQLAKIADRYSLV